LKNLCAKARHRVFISQIQSPAFCTHVVQEQPEEQNLSNSTFFADLNRSLWTLYPENPEYIIRAADAQIRAGNGQRCAQEIAVLRKQSDSGRPDFIANDPRL